MEEVCVFGIIFIFLKYGFDEESEIKILIEDECNLDNIIYILFVRSIFKEKLLLFKRVFF